MQNAEIKKLLQENQWISRLKVSNSRSGPGSRLQVSITPPGHQFIGEFGFQAFSNKLLAEIRPIEEHLECLECLHDHHWILDGIQTGGVNSKPGIISWIQDVSEHRLLLDVNPELVFFKGHFPGNPILPGVVQLHWAVGISASLFEFNGIPYEIKRLKFSNIVQPPSVLELHLNQKNETGVQFKFTSFGRVHSMGSLEFREKVSC